MFNFAAKLCWLLNSKIRDYEKAILFEVAKNMADTASAVFLSQLKCNNLIQRHDSDREVNFYVIKWGKVKQPVEFQFPNTTPELLLGRAYIRTQDSKSRFCAEVWVVSGYFFQIKFDSSPTALFKKSYQFDNCEILADMMAVPTGDYGSPIE